MTDFKAMVNTICLYFSKRSDFEDVFFVTEFPKMKKSQPLTRPVVSVGIESITDKKLDGVYDNSTDSPTLLYNREAVVKLRFIIHVPQALNGLKCYEIVTRIGKVLMDGSFNWNFDLLQTDGITYDRDKGAYVQTAYIGITDRTIDKTDTV